MEVMRSTRGLALATILVSLLFDLGCGTPNRAPVVSRELGQQQDFRRSGYYQVRPGDTLYAFAWETGSDYRELAAWNGIRDLDRIYVGQKLRLSPPASVMSAGP